MEIKEDRFIECMAIDFPNFKISKSNLSHPTPQFVISFYSLILRNVIELNDPDEIWNVTDDQRAYINSYHPEAVSFGQHVWIYNLHAAIKYVFNHLSENVTEFVYSDILFPENTPRRSFVFMALMMNFYWYTNDFALDLDPDISACLQKVEDIKNMKEDRDKLMSQLRELEFQRCQYVELYKEKKKLVSTKTEVNEEREITMKELLADEETALKAYNKVEEEREKLQATLTKVQNEKSYCESLVVSNENQVKDILEKRLLEKDDWVRKMKIQEQKVKSASNALTIKNKVLELQQKLNQALKEEDSSQDPQSKHKGFQSLYKLQSALMEKKKKLSEKSLTPDQQIQELEEKLAKSESDNSKLRAEEENITLRGKEKIQAKKKVLEEQIKSYNQIFTKMRKKSELMDGVNAIIVDLTAKATKHEKDISNHDATNKTKYKTYVKEMKTVFTSLDDIFQDSGKDILGFNSLIPEIKF